MCILISQSLMVYMPDIFNLYRIMWFYVSIGTFIRDEMRSRCHYYDCFSCALTWYWISEVTVRFAFQYIYNALKAGWEFQPLWKLTHRIMSLNCRLASNQWADTTWLTLEWRWPLSQHIQLTNFSAHSDIDSHVELVGTAKARDLGLPYGITISNCLWFLL